MKFKPHQHLGLPWMRMRLFIFDMYPAEIKLE